MKLTQTSIAKITRPRLPKIFARKRLFRLLDAKKGAPVTWVSGPAGSGKTTLVTSWLDDCKLPCIWYQVDEGDADLATFFYYMGLAAKKAAPRYKQPLPLLTPEYGLGVPTFASRYFEKLCSRLKPPHVLIFDNYQEVPAESAFHDIFSAGLSALPGDITAVIISRSEPPPAFAGMLAGNKLQVMGWSDLKLTPEESRGIIRFQGIVPFLSDWIHEKTNGWAAGLVLLSRAVKTEGIDPEAVKSLPPEKVFDYFASELFDRLERPTQDFLLKTAIVPKITPYVAAELTGNKHAGHILSELNRKNYFTEKRQHPELSYQYHALFREFLLNRAASIFPSEELRELRLSAAKLLEASGQVEDAAETYLHAQEWAGLTGLVMRNAPALMKQGRTDTLGKWLAALPQELVSREPWLLYWSGASRMFFNPLEGQANLEKAFHLFNSRKDPMGTFLSWAGLANCIAYTMEDLTQFDHWVSILDGLLKEYGGFPSKEVEGWAASAMIPAIALRQPDRPDFDSWKTSALLNDEMKIHTLFQVAFYYTYRGDTLHSDQMKTALYRHASEPGVSPLGLILAKLFDAAANTFVYVPGDCIKSAYEGLALAEESGIHIMDSMILGNAAVAALSRGDLLLARSFLQKMAASTEKGGAWDRAFYNFLLASEALLLKDMNKALRHSEEALQLALRVGIRISIVLCYYLNALVRYECGDADKAYELLETGRREAEMLGSALTTFQYLLLKTIFDFGGRDKKAAHASLKKAMALGREHGIFTIHPQVPPALLFLVCAEALEAGIEVEYVRKLIRHLNLVPEDPPLHIENWPWPVKIFTLGGFKLMMDDRPIAFGGKAQKKPLEMLKALVALGGNDVREGRLTDALWPDAEGDTAKISFRTTLHRLRQIVGNDNALSYRDGALSLDPRYCWTDVWAFERMLESFPDESFRGQAAFGVQSSELKRRKGKSAMRNPQSEMIQQLEKALSLYRGHYLADDLDKPWALSLRERLKSRFVQTVSTLGEILESRKEWKKAVAVYERGIEVDDLAEELYQRLMICHQRLGRKADAVKVYRRCRQLLRSKLGVELSREAESIYETIKK